MKVYSNVSHGKTTLHLSEDGQITLCKRPTKGMFREHDHIMGVPVCIACARAGDIEAAWQDEKERNQAHAAKIAELTKKAQVANRAAKKQAQQTLNKIESVVDVILPAPPAVEQKKPPMFPSSEKIVRHVEIDGIALWIEIKVSYYVQGIPCTMPD